MKPLERVTLARLKEKNAMKNIRQAGQVVMAVGD